MSPDKNPPTPIPTVREAARKLLDRFDEAQADIWVGGAMSFFAGARDTLRLALDAELAPTPPVWDPKLAQDGIDLIKRHAPPGELTADHVTAVVDAAESAFVLARSFEVRLDADRRAVARWQAGEPSPDVKALIETGKTLRTALGDIDWSNGEDNPPYAAISALSAALDDAETGINTPAGHRGPIWPDQADLLVWLLELLDVRPPCPSPDEVDEMIRRLRAIYVASPMVHDACAMMEKLANALIASSRRTVVAESDRAIIPLLIVAWLRSQGTPGSQVAAFAGVFARQIEAGEWLPLRGAAILAERELHVEAEEQGRQMRLVSGCEESIVGDLGKGSMEETHVGDRSPRFYDSLRVVLARPDVKEAIGKALAIERGADWETATEAGRNAFRDEAAKLLREAAQAPRA